MSRDAAMSAAIARVMSSAVALTDKKVRCVMPGVTRLLNQATKPGASSATWSAKTNGSAIASTRSLGGSCQLPITVRVSSDVVRSTAGRPRPWVARNPT